MQLNLHNTIHQFSKRSVPTIRARFLLQRASMEDGNISNGRKIPNEIRESEICREMSLSLKSHKELPQGRPV